MDMQVTQICHSESETKYLQEEHDSLSMWPAPWKMDNDSPYLF